MSSEPPPLRPWIIPLIIFALNVIAFGVLSVTGAVENLSPAVQFYFGASTLAFPLIIYLLLKRRARRDDG